MPGRWSAWSLNEFASATPEGGCDDAELEVLRRRAEKANECYRSALIAKQDTNPIIGI